MIKYSWNILFKQILKHKKILFIGNFFAIISILISVPTPLFMPVLIDEIILDKPDKFVEYTNIIFNNPNIYTYLIIIFTLVVSFRGVS